MQPHVDCSFADTETNRDVFEAQILEVSQYDNLALLRR